MDSSLPNYPPEAIRALRYLKSRALIFYSNLPSFIMASIGYRLQLGVWLCVFGFALAQDQSKYFGSKDETFHRCQVMDRVPCGDPGISGAGCEALNCCFDQQCYYPNEGSSAAFYASCWQALMPAFTWLMLPFLLQLLSTVSGMASSWLWYPELPPCLCLTLVQ